MKDLIKNFRFILNCYIGEINNHNITDIKQLLTEMDKIENNLNKIKTVRLLKAKVNELVDMCLYKMRILYDSLSDFICGEIHFWENSNLKKNFLIIKCQNQANPKA